MTNDEIRIKIAGSCGWRITSTTKYSWVVISPLNMEVAWSSQAGEMNDKPASFYLPNYPEDLNAMHEAESVCIGTIHAKKHGQMLQEVTGWHCVGVVPDHARDLTHLSKLSRATAAQRAEAFLRTLNLWEE